MILRFSAFRRNAQQTQRGFDGRLAEGRFPKAGLGAAQQESMRATAHTLLANTFQNVPIKQWF